MTKQEKAEIILKNLDEYISIDHNFEKYYIKAITNGLKEIKEIEKEEEA